MREIFLVCSDKAICLESVELVYVVYLLYFRSKTVLKNKETNETQPSPDTLCLKVFYLSIFTDITKDMTDKRCLLHACLHAVPPCHHAITTAITVPRGSASRWAMASAVPRFGLLSPCRPPGKLSSTEASARRLGSHPHLEANETTSLANLCLYASNLNLILVGYWLVA